MQILDIKNHYLKNRDKLVKRARFRLGNDDFWAEDVVQETYERAIRYKASCDANNFDQWLNTILNNCIKDYRNIENGYMPEYEGDEETDSFSCPHYTDQVMKEIKELIDTKAQVQQEILNLYFKYEYSPADIARLTDHSYANCHKIVYRFRQELRELYGE